MTTDTTATAGTSSIMIGLTARAAGNQQETTRNGTMSMDTMMSRSVIRVNADRIRAIRTSMLTIRNSMNKVAKANQQAVDHYTQWEPKYDEFEDRESAIRSAEIAMRLEQAADDLQAAAHQMEQALKIAVEGEMR